MKSNVIIAAVILARVADSAAITVPNCNGDDCLRAVQAAQNSGSSKQIEPFRSPNTADCPSCGDNDYANNQNEILSFAVPGACSCNLEKRTTVLPTTTQAETKTLQPCAEVSASWSAQIETTAMPTVAASLALECLKSVPLGKEGAMKIVDGIEPFLEWQSDITYKKNPPKGYFYPGYDMLANLAKVKSNLKSGNYSGEYDFQIDLFQEVSAPSSDGHFVLLPDILDIFRWRRQSLAIVSVSEDGDSLPVIKLQSEVVANPKTAQTITKINGIEASKYVEDTANLAPDFQDVDAAYNSMFWSKTLHATSKASGNFVGGGRIGFLYPGPATNITFANSTTIELENKATVLANMTNVLDGPSLYAQFCSPPMNPLSNAPPQPRNSLIMNEDSQQSLRQVRSTPTNGTLDGYPDPVIVTKDGAVSGYYLSGQGFEDVAVVALTSFEPEYHISTPAEFQAVVSDFLREAKSAGKKKLIVDVQNNPGGNILLGYDFFRQLFPSVLQDGYSRWKLNPGFSTLSEIISEHAEDPDLASRSDPDFATLPSSWFNYRSDLNLTNQNFSTFADKFNPHLYEGANYTALMRWNMSDPRITTNETTGAGIEISGYGNRANLTQHFNAEDIVLLHDGACSSTCAVASGALHLQGGVKSIAMGGRPQRGPMQAIGGVKGAQSLDLYSIQNYAYIASQLTNSTDAQSKLSRLSSVYLLNRLRFNVNARDQILRSNVADGVPAQYIYEAADCRLYWTAAMISDISEVWKSAANSAFNGAKCAAGGISRSEHTRTTSRTTGFVSRNALSQRLSESIDTSAVKSPKMWRAMHNQKAELFRLAMG